MSRIFFPAALVVSLGLSAGAFAQGGVSGGGGGSTGFGGGSTGGTGLGGGGSSFGGGTSLSGGGSSFSGSGGTSFSGGSSFSGSGNTSFSGGQGGTIGGRTGAGGRAVGGSSGVSISPTNFLAATYGNPLYNGRPGSTNVSPKAGGGFGQASFGAVSTTVVSTTGGLAGARTAGGVGSASVSRAGGIGSGLGGGYGGGSVSPITYAAQVRFAAPPVVPSRLQTDLQGLVSRTSAVRTPGTVRVEVVEDTVYLRGRVADDDERRLVEGMVRLEPGVHVVVNELTVP